MADPSYTPEEQELFEREVERTLRTELPSVREEEIRAAAQRAAQREMDLRRDELRDQLDDQVEDSGVESRSELRQEANRETPSKLLIGLVLLLLLLFILAATGQLSFGANSGSTSAEAAANNVGGAVAPLQPVFSEQANLAAQAASAAPNAQIGRGPDVSGEQALNDIDRFDPPIDPLFREFYLQHDGLRLFGRPLARRETNSDGRIIQWFERTRLEYWPELENTPYRVQSGLVGEEYTDGRQFPDQTFFPCAPTACFFAETSHAVRGKFYEYWQRHGGIDLIGYPISEEVFEVAPDTGFVRRVQYFQRARMELHSEHAGTEDEVQLGLLGRGIYRNEPRAAPIIPDVPTPVPLPSPAP